MERQGRLLVSSGTPELAFKVIASEGLDDLPEDVDTVRLRLPRRPAVARIVWFYLRSGSVIRRHRRACDVVHTCGAITRARVDVATVHLCQAAASREATGYQRGWRRLNSAAARVAARAIERHCYQPQRVKSLIAVSSAIANELNENYPDVEHLTIPNGVKVSSLNPLTDRANESRELVRAVMVTGDFALKGVDTVIESLALARHVSLTVVGPGESDHLMAIARRLGVENRVVFTGFVEDVGPYYGESDIVVCASHYESFGLFLVEGALSGCAIVSNEVGIAPDLVGPGDGGIIVQRSAVAYADAFNELDADRERMFTCGEVARRRASAFTSDAMVSSYASFYATVAPS